MQVWTLEKYGTVGPYPTWIIYGIFETFESASDFAFDKGWHVDEIVITSHQVQP